jgi:hypothetical protein
MLFMPKAFNTPFLLAIVTAAVLCSSVALAQKSSTAVVWADPGDINSKDLTNGSGGSNGDPKLPVRFLEEDQGGHNSKLEVEDAASKKWKAKLGIEARPETVASRLMWAVGYFTNDNYLIKNLEVDGLPAKLKRGQGHVTSPNHLDEARLQRSIEGKKKGNWSWKNNPLKSTREFNGLRVMMALLGNWDLKDENNAIYVDKDGTERYVVTDLGTAFGPSGDRWTEAQSKNNLKAYQSTKFITHKTDKHVSFSLPRFPPFLYIFDLPHFWHQASMRPVGNNIPREDAKWIGSLLAQLSTKQIEDAFRAGGYSPDEASAFTKVVESRIAELKQL